MRHRRIISALLVLFPFRKLVVVDVLTSSAFWRTRDATLSFFVERAATPLRIHPLTRTTLPNLHRFFNSLVPFGFIPLEIIIDSGLYYKRRNMNGHGGSSTVTVLYKVANAGKEDAGLFNAFEIPRGSGLTLATVKR